MKNHFSLLQIGSGSTYHILDHLNNQIGRTNHGFHGWHVHLTGIYFGIDDAPNRRGGSTAGVVKRLRYVIDFVSLTMETISAADALADAEKKAALVLLICVKANESKGEVLNWLVAKALQFDVDLNMYGRFAPMHNEQIFNPLDDLPLVINIMSEYVKTIENLFSDGLYSVTALKDEAKIGICVGETIALATLRCLVVSELGQNVNVPSCLLNL
ncbi:hypothetical protein [Rhodoferax antarcticus]|uniref:hypothetical protein n=1 Tax=Rhodoferax antarcticus TaxID=81479 RepID=UPI000A86389F|nr:hypothetical protein [Rhodoferax antarcticus]